jgi:hypothetical protein
LTSDRAVGSGGGVTVVRGEARRRWIVVLSVVAVLCALPLAVRAWPVRAAGPDAAALRERMLASADRPYQGYALSTGSMGLPELPRLAEVSALLSSTSQMRAWYAGRDRWRVDVVDTGAERGLYQTPNGQYVWDYAGNQLTRVVGEQPARLPRAADLMPPDLARRLLAAADGDGIAPVPARRVAGVAAAGLRITPSDPRTTIGRVDIWADPSTGLPVQVEVTGRGADRPVVVTRFLELEQAAPNRDVLTPPDARPGMGFTVTITPDVVSALDRLRFARLPARLAGQPRRDPVGDLSAVAVYGTGLARWVVLPLPGRVGAEAYDGAERWGRDLDLPDGEAVLISRSLLSVVVLRPGGRRTYLIAGLVEADLLRRAAAELAEFRR